jgi:hypothetical protein
MEPFRAVQAVPPLAAGFVITNRLVWMPNPYVVLHGPQAVHLPMQSTRVENVIDQRVNLMFPLSVWGFFVTESQTYKDSSRGPCAIKMG